MVQGMDVKGRRSVLSLDVKPSNSLFSNNQSQNSNPDEGRSSVVEAIGNAMAFRKVDCESVDEILKFCGNSPASGTERKDSLDVNELERSLKLPSGGRIEHMPALRSPGLLYKHKFADKSSSTYFPFESRPQSTRSRTKRRTQRTNTTPVLGKAAKNCFLLGAFNRDYSVGSVTTSLLKENDRGAMFMETHTVVLLGELSVGKSALCKKFFRSGMVGRNPVDHPSPSGPYEDDDDDDFMHPSIRISDDSELYEETPRSDSHHIYERPITVNGECSRIRILDINAEKHRMECEDYGDFEPYLGTGDAYIIAYAVTDKGTFKTVAEILSRMSRHHPHRMAVLPIILVGNKCDLVRRRQVGTTDGIRLAAKYNAKFIETSASLNQNVEKLFEGVIQQIRLRNTCNDLLGSDSSQNLDSAGKSSNGLKDHPASDVALHTLDAESQKSSDSSSLPDSDTEDWLRGSRNSSFRRRNSASRVATDGVKSSSASTEASASSDSKEKRKYKKRASRCLMKILHRKNSSEKARKSKSCQDLSIL